MKKAYLKILIISAVCIYGGNDAKAELQQQLGSSVKSAGRAVKSWFNDATGNAFDTATGEAFVDSARDSSLAGLFSSASPAVDLETVKKEKIASTTRQFQFIIEGLITGFRHELMERPESFTRIAATAGTAKAFQTAANIVIPGSGTVSRIVARGIGNAVSAAIKSASKGRSTNMYRQISLSAIEEISTTVAEGLITKYGPLVLAFESNRLNDFLSHLAWRVEATGRHLIQKGESLDGQSILNEFSNKKVFYRRPAKDRLKSEAKGLVQGSLSKRKVGQFLTMPPEKIAEVSEQYERSNDTLAKVVKKTVRKMKRSKKASAAAAPAA